MCMMNRIDAIGNQPQMAFKAKAGDRKAIHEFIDKFGIETPRDFVEMKFSPKAYNETLIRRYVKKFNELIKKIIK